MFKIFKTCVAYASFIFLISTVLIMCDQDTKNQCLDSASICTGYAVGYITAEVKYGYEKGFSEVKAKTESKSSLVSTK